MAWDPARYNQFRKERAAPFDDLARLLVIRAGLSVVDLGCGTGDLTSRLAEMLPGSDVLGVDSSSAMLARAAEHVRPGLHFEQGNLETVHGEFDLVFSHAAIQWVDDHETLIPSLWAMVRPGGQLAVQVPSNHSHPTHTLIQELAASPQFSDRVGGYNRWWPVLSIERYAELLFSLGGVDIVVYEKVYPHVLPDADALADWMSGTALVPYKERMDPEDFEEFMHTYRARLWGRYPDQPVFFGFRRTLFSAIKPAV